MQNFNSYDVLAVKNRGKLQRFFFAAVFFILLYKFFSKLLISQLGENPVSDQGVDPTYWLFRIIDIPGIIKGNVAIVFDLILFTSCVVSSIFPKQFISPLVFFFTYFIYFILFNMTAGHHYGNVGILLVSFAFIFKDKLFGFSLSFSRLLFMFIMCSAALWKIVRGNLFYTGQFEMIMTTHNLPLLLSENRTIRYEIIKWLIQHSSWLHLIWISLIIMESSFVIGFFTFKKDSLLLIIYLLFAAGGVFLTNIFNIENFLFLLTLYPSVYFISRLTIFKKNKRIGEQKGITSI